MWSFGSRTSLRKLRRPTLIIFAEDDMVTQLKAGYLLRDAIGTSRLEVLDRQNSGVDEEGGHKHGRK